MQTETPKTGRPKGSYGKTGAAIRRLLPKDSTEFEAVDRTAYNRFAALLNAIAKAENMTYALTRISETEIKITRLS